MAGKLKRYLGNFVILLVAACVALYAYYLYFGDQMAKPVEAVLPIEKVSTPYDPPEIDVPRTENPMGDYTQFFEKQIMAVNNVNYTYYIYTPSKPWPENISFPVVMILHGGTGKNHSIMYLLSEAVRNSYPAIIFVPVISEERFWAMPIKPGSDLDTLPDQYAIDDMVDIIEKLKIMYPINDERIYALGCYDGGTGVFGALRFFPHYFAAGIAMHGYWAPDDYESLTSTPILVMNSGQDTIIDPRPASQLAYAIKDAGGDAVYHQFDIAEDRKCPAPAMHSDDVWKWLFSKRLEKAGVSDGR